MVKEKCQKFPMIELRRNASLELAGCNASLKLALQKITTDRQGICVLRFL